MSYYILADRLGKINKSLSHATFERIDSHLSGFEARHLGDGGDELETGVDS